MSDPSTVSGDMPTFCLLELDLVDFINITDQTVMKQLAV